MDKLSNVFHVNFRMPLPTQKRDKVHLNPCFKVYLICLYVKSKHSRVKHSLNSWNMIDTIKLAKNNYPNIAELK
jgi:hypothetical protein